MVNKFKGVGYMNKLDLNVLREILIKEVDEFLIELENGEEVVYIPSVIHMDGKCIRSVSTDVGTIIRDYNRKMGGDVQSEEVPR